MGDYLIERNYEYDPKKFSILFELKNLESLDENQVSQIISIYKDFCDAAAPATPESLRFHNQLKSWKSIYRNPIYFNIILMLIFGTLFIVVQTELEFLKDKNCGYILQKLEICLNPDLGSNIKSTNNYCNWSCLNSKLGQIKPIFLHYKIDGWKSIFESFLYISAAALGAILYNLYTIEKYINKNAYISSYKNSYIIRLFLGTISGYVLAQLIWPGFPTSTRLDSSSTPTEFSFTPVVIALIGGFSADTLEIILRRIASTIKSVFKGSIESKQDKINIKTIKNNI